MSWTQQLLSSAFEFLLSVCLAVFVVYWSYRSFARAHTKFNAQEEIYKGNTAVAILMASLMYASALVMRECIFPVMSIITVAITSGGEGGHSYWLLALHAVGHLVLGFLLSVGCVMLALRAFNWLNRHLDEEKEVARGNTAVSVIMSAVVLVVALYVQSGVGALTKSLLPQPKLGSLRMVDDAGFALDEAPQAEEPSQAPTAQP